MKALEQQILDALQAMNAEDTPVTVTDLARRCRADAQLVLRSARHLVETGRAEPAMVDVYGVPTMYELILQSAPIPMGKQSESAPHT